MALLQPVSLAAACGTIAFYIVASWALQLWFFAGRADDVRSWKTQPTKQQAQVGASARGLPWLPALWWRAKPGRLPGAWLFATLNLLQAGLFAGATMEAFQRGRTALISGRVAPAWAGGGATAWLAGSAVVAAQGLGLVLLHVCLEYAWHRAMHGVPFLYKHLHKRHHQYKAPSTYDDMDFHSLEALGYYVIFWCPALFVPAHAYSFLAYLSVLGVTGILDHSGIKLSLRVGGVTLYDTRDHDLHHSHFNVNYGFPLMFLDHLLHTYASPDELPQLHERPAGRERSGSSAGAAAAPALAAKTQRRSAAASRQQLQEQQLRGSPRSSPGRAAAAATGARAASIPRQRSRSGGRRAEAITSARGKRR